MKEYRIDVLYVGHAKGIACLVAFGDAFDPMLREKYRKKGGNDDSSMNGTDNGNSVDDGTIVSLFQKNPHVGLIGSSMMGSRSPKSNMKKKKKHQNDRSRNTACSVGFLARILGIEIADVADLTTCNGLLFLSSVLKGREMENDEQ